jgi:antitoxin ParD1/3/4
MAMTDVHLTPGLERFAEACVPSGAYESVSAVAQAAFRLLEVRERAKAELLQSLVDAEAEAERDGWIPGDEVMAGWHALADDIESEHS